MDKDIWFHSAPSKFTSMRFELDVCSGVDYHIKKQYNPYSTVLWCGERQMNTGWCVRAELHSLCRRVVELVLPGATEAGLHPSVHPQPLNDSGQLRRHEALLRRARQHKQLARVILRGRSGSGVNVVQPRCRRIQDICRHEKHGFMNPSRRWMTSK